jgi:serine/threonine protein kinase/Tol biopolymer transport system component
MGEVYRARDTRLERTVAIKILPRELSNDAIRKQRFEREAKTISSLNHPHICVLHDVGSQDGIDYLVMECVEGEILSKRLEKGSLSLDQVLKVGREIADALDSAHRSGVVHRDLKPGNIMLTSAGAKLLDFGLAKPAAALASAATLTAVQAAPVTEEGTIVGTFQYMSPEQVQGKEVDGRSDIFSLGTVLYEMATGKRAFEGKSQLSVASAILEKEPEPISVAKPMTPPALDHAVKKCLAKVPDERWQSASDLASELKWISESSSQAGVAGRVSPWRSRRERSAWLLAAVLSVLLIGAGAAWWQAGNKRAQAMYFHAAVPFAANDVVLSPDGRKLAIAAYSAQADNSILWTYDVGSRKVSAADGTKGATFPFWSPDARFIGFFADGKLKKVEASGGQPQVLCDAPNGRGGAWNRDGVILFTPDGLGALFRTSSSGSPPVEITKLDTSRLETSHRWPVFLPDGKHFLYLAANFSGQLENNGIFLGSLDSQERRFVVSTSANAAYAEPGYLLYLRDDKTLVAQAFDHRRYVLTGEAHNLSDGVLYFPTVDRAVFSASSGDVLVTQTGKGAFVSQLTWFDRTGKAISTLGPPEAYGNVRISPDGHFVATSQISADGRSSDIWILESARAATTRLTFGPAAHQTPVWSPDGKQVLFVMNRKLGQQLYLKNVDGSGSEEEVVELSQGRQGNPWDWSRDGKYILCRRANEVWYLTWPDRVAKPLLQARWTVLNAQLSPDGRWVAYASNETGSMEIYVSPFPSVNGKWQVSNGGGQEARWRQDGKELFYVSAEGKMMSVGVVTGASFKGSPPVALFQTHRRQPISAQDAFSYDVSSDGQKFLIITRMDEASAAPPSVLLNWASEMEK